MSLPYCVAMHLVFNSATSKRLFAQDCAEGEVQQGFAEFVVDVIYNKSINATRS